VKAGQWSGLAPAVDAHLALWSQSERARAYWRPLINVNQGTPSESIRDVKRAFTNVHVQRWIKFSASYGLPDDTGKPAVGLALRYGAETMEGSTIIGIEQFGGDDKSVLQGAILCEREYQMLSGAVSHYVSGDVMDLVTSAAELAEPEMLWPTDLFTPCGFAVFEKPLIVTDLHPETGAVDERLHVWVRAMGWQVHPGMGSMSDKTVGDGVSLFFYTTGWDYEHGNMADLEAIGITDHLDPVTVDEGLLPIEVIPWRFGRPWTVRNEVGYRPGTLPSSVAYQRRWFLAFMRLMWQEIVVRHRDDPKRATVRQWERLAKRKPLLDYTVLKLRREHDPVHHETGTGTPLDHRVRVRPHWRRVHVKSLGPARLPDGSMNPETHRLVYIEAHWRGPEEGPIGAMHSATSFTR